MIALERDIGGAERIAAQPVEHAAGIRSAVDVVAQRHGEALLTGHRAQVAVDQPNHAIEQIAPAVDVPDHIDAPVRCRVECHRVT